ncbi:MAG: ATP-binding protein [Chloroflexota bacterium]
MLKIRLFGPLAVEQDGQSLPLPASAQARDLLAYLALFHERQHSRSLLVGTFWPEQAEERARRALSQALWQIRRFFPDLVTAEAETIGFSPQAPLWVDAQDFEKLVKSAVNVTSQETIRQDLEQAVALYRADFLEGNYHDWVLLEREHLRELYLQALERLGQLEKSSGHYARALDLALRLSGAEPLNEAAHREIMRLHHLLGQPEAAARQFEQCRDVLRRELDVEPSPETLAVVEEINHLSERAASATKTARESLIPTPLVGRETDRSALLQFLEGIFHKLGGLVLLEGEAGVGKTRLLQDLARDAEWRGAQVLWGSARETQERKPYAPLVEALQSGLSPLRVTQIQQVVERIWLQTVFPLLSPHPALPAIEPAPPLPPAQEGARLVEAIARLIQGWADVTPLVLVLEDLHWADQDTFDLLAALTRRLSSRSILIIGSYRGEDARANPLVWEGLQAINRGSLLSQRVLSRLDRQATGELIRRSLGLASPAPLFEERLFRETDGNPLFVLEALRALQDEGLLTRDENGTWSTPWDEKTADYAELPLPPVVEQVITRRLERLPSHLIPAIRLAAVLGGHFDFDLFLAVNDLPPQKLLEETRSLIQSNFLEETAAGYRFSHEIIRQAVYEQMSAEIRVDIHRRVGEALEKLETVQPATLAYHFAWGRNWCQAAHYHYQAGLQSMNAFAYAAAREHFSQAISFLEAAEVSTIEQFDLFAAREKVSDILGDRQAQSKDLEVMERIAHGDDARLCRAALRRAWLLTQTNHYEEAQAAARKAQELGRALNDTAAQAEALNMIGTALTWQGKTADSIEPLRNAVELAQQSGDLLTEARYRRALASSHLGIREYDAARRELEISLQRAAQHNDLLEQAEGLNLLGIIHMERGATEEALPIYEQSIEHCRKIGFLYGEGRALVNLGNLCYFQGRLGETLRLYDQAIQIFEALDEKRGEVQLRLNRASITLNVLGNSPQVKADSQFALDYARQVDDPISLGQALTVLAEAERQEGEIQKARTHLEEGIRVMEKTGDRWLLAQEYRTLGSLNIEDSRFDEAIENLEQALAICQQLGLEDMQPPILGIRGLALLGMARFEEALQSTEEAMRRLSPDVEQGYLIPYWHAQALNAVGRSAEACAAITQSYEMLQKMLSGLSPEQQRLSLENVQEHREIMTAWQAGGPRRVIVRLPRASQADDWVEVTWTLEAPEDKTIPGKVARRRHRLRRLLEEARQQGAIPTNQRLADALGVSLRTVERDMAGLGNRLPPNIKE